MHGRRIFHARGKVLGGSSSINGQIFQRGNPLDYERWAADPGMATWDYAHCLPYFKKMETCLAAARRPVARPRRPARPRTRPGDQPALHRVLRRVPGGGLPADRRRQRLSPGGVRAVRPEHPPRPAAERGPGVPPPDHGHAQEPDGPHLRPSSRGINLDGRPGGRRRDRAPRGRHGAHRGRRGHPRGRGDQLAAAPAARGHRPGGRPRSARHPGRRPTCPGSASTSRTISRSTSSTRACSRCRCSRRPRNAGAGRSSARSGCSCAPGPGATNHFEGGGFARSNDEVAYPNLMFHFLPLAIRYDGSAGAADHGYQVHVGPMYSDARGSSDAQDDRPARPSGAALQLPLDRPGPARMGRGHPGRPARSWDQPAMAAFNGGETSPGPTVDHRRGDPRLGRARRRDRAPSVVHGADGDGRGLRRRPVDDARPRAGRAARGRRLRHAVRHQRQHLRPGDDARREGRRPHQGRHAAGTRAASRSTATG